MVKWMTKRGVDRPVSGYTGPHEVLCWNHIQRNSHLQTKSKEISFFAQSFDKILKLGQLFNLQQNSLKYTSDTFLITKFSFVLCSGFSEIHVLHCLFQKARLDTFSSFFASFHYYGYQPSLFGFFSFLFTLPNSLYCLQQRSTQTVTQKPMDTRGSQKMGGPCNLIISL